MYSYSYIIHKPIHNLVYTNKKPDNVLLRWNDLIYVFWESVRGAFNFHRWRSTCLLRRFRNRQITISLLLFWKLQFWIFHDLSGPARSRPFAGRGVQKSYLGKKHVFLLMSKGSGWDHIYRKYCNIIEYIELYRIRLLVQYSIQYIEIIEILYYFNIIEYFELYCIRQLIQ